MNRTEIFDENGKLVEILVIQNATGSMVDNIAFIYHFTPTTRNVTFADETVVSVRVWEIKFDIQISGFAWSANNTMLALSARFDSKFEVKSLGEAEVRFETVDRVTPFFNWGGSATGDGSEIEVGATVSERIVTLSYPYFEYELIHDPSIGYIVSSILEAIVLVPMIMAVGAVIAVTAVLGSSLLRQERLRKRLEESL